ncbi:IS66 family transposase [Bradyrhizobium arachidis]|uniref:IS66 family transposase n=1 Tax=Bradyrhizobium arachidis TaxID=858423 RepID=UPI002162BD4D|nr:IS66 family transposase [Bradyrhizobium arachidis]UVO30240.1 IS66 family transposase [Bradyrhizobium arachidis]
MARSSLGICRRTGGWRADVVVQSNSLLSHHAQRNFIEVFKTRSSFTREVIGRLQEVYAIEAEIRGSSAEQRLSARHTRSTLLLAAFKARLAEMADSCSPNRGC